MCPAPTPNHQDIVLSFAERLKGFVAKGKLGKVYISPVDVVLTSHRVVQPDVLFITKSRLQIVKRHIAGIPDLVVEVISEGTWQRDRIQKKALYEQFGLPEYWIVDPDSRTIEIFTLANGGYQLHAKGSDAERVKSKLLPGFQVSFAELNR
jgi:Uma2 family endonuclease